MDVKQIALVWAFLSLSACHFERYLHKGIYIGKCTFWDLGIARGTSVMSELASPTGEMAKNARN